MATSEGFRVSGTDGLTVFVEFAGCPIGPTMRAPFINGVAAWLNGLSEDDRRRLAGLLSAPADGAAATPPQPTHAGGPGWFNAAVNYASGYQGGPVWVWREGPCAFCGKPITEEQVKPHGYSFTKAGPAHNWCAGSPPLVEAQGEQV